MGCALRWPLFWQTIGYGKHSLNCVKLQSRNPPVSNKRNDSDNNYIYTNFPLGTNGAKKSVWDFFFFACLIAGRCWGRMANEKTVNTVSNANWTMKTFSHLLHCKCVKKCINCLLNVEILFIFILFLLQKCLGLLRILNILERLSIWQNNCLCIIQTKPVFWDIYGI